jgi:hypothetical protein
VYDLLGTGTTALKYSLNRYNQMRTTGIANLEAISLTDSGFAMARHQRQRHRGR